MRKFVRRYKRKGGEDGKPGDLDALIKELMAIAGEDIDEQQIRDLLESEEEDAWAPIQGVVNCLDEADRIKFQVTLNKV